MASSSNDSGNLVDDFEEAFQACISVLVNEENSSVVDRDEVRSDVDQTILRFLDSARQMENFFLQKRFLLAALKSELVVKEDTNDLRLELIRKDELIKKHYEKIAVWQSILADLQGGSKSPAQGQPPTIPSSSQSQVQPSMGVSHGNYVTGPGNRMPFPNMGQTQGPQGNLAGPLAYLEKTASNIGLTEGRR